MSNTRKVRELYPFVPGNPVRTVAFVMFLSTEKTLWYIIAFAGLPYLVLLAMLENLQDRWLPLLVLTGFVFLFDWIFIPLFFFRNKLTWGKKLLTIGINVLLSGMFLGLTGGAGSVFYPHFYYLPVLIACVYGGLWESLVTTVVVISLSVFTFDWQLYYSGMALAAQSLTFFLVAVLLGFVIDKEKQQRRDNELMAQQLQNAYEELSSSHSQLQAYTEMMEDMNVEMEQLAITDDLTVLYNYRYFQNCLAHMLKQKHCHPLAMVMLDIDYFKIVNDTWGHQAGNVVLVKLADIIREQVRDGDVVVRYGGEEFALLLPNSTAEGAQMVSERIRIRVAEEVFYQMGDEQLHISVSLGVTVYPLEATDKSELISNADKAMYRAKELGRNKVVMFKDIAEGQQSQ